MSADSELNVVNDLNDSMSICALGDDSNSLVVPEKCLQLKKFKDLGDDYKTFRELGYDSRRVEESHSIVHPAIFLEGDDIYVIQKILVPELHSMQGELFEGNASRELLENPDIFVDPEICKNVDKLLLLPYVSAFIAMKKIVDCCFSEKRGPDLEKHINELSQALEYIDVSETLKIHVNLTHLIHCLHFLDEDDALGLWSEQAGKSVQREFLKYWGRYKVDSVQNPAYAEKLKQAVIAFSSLHL
ncbi:hypothetical protein QAD02_015006 [Eretmocerus hayati]|uniref:Uncharacterized protein n=1 Tax=Eretmocerus hayati TaxID=131215 RepID=A0ACC2P9F7_9HYME|nr:hypothetical protein QAD02_015006 [Eretmocerus hayati]